MCTSLRLCFYIYTANSLIFIASSYLFEVFYDGLVDCLNSVVHAKEDSDVVAAYEHMLNFLSLGIEDKDDEGADSENLDGREDDFDRF